VVQVAAGTTVGMITCASSKKVYVKSIICHQPSITNATAQVYFVPNGGAVGTSTKLFDVNVNAGETVLIEPSYPLVLDTTGDSLRVGAGTSEINFLITGDKEA
jgi:hypothetical protein